MNSSQPLSQLQSMLAAPAASFARQRNHGYASLQELTAGTHQHAFHFRGKGGDEFNANN